VNSVLKNLMAVGGKQFPLRCHDAIFAARLLVEIVNL
jgi:hypothetical protein